MATGTGFVVLRAYLDGPDLEAAQRDLGAVYPTFEGYHEGRNQK
jgi:hypothetical protein